MQFRFIAKIQFHESSQVGGAIEIERLAFKPEAPLLMVVQGGRHLDSGCRIAQLNYDIERLSLCCVEVIGFAEQGALKRNIQDLAGPYSIPLMNLTRGIEQDPVEEAAILGGHSGAL